MVLIIDGYNVIHALPPLARALDVSLEESRRALLAMCEAIRRRRRDVREIFAVFDGDERYGHPSEGARAGARVVFTSRREDADERILSLIRRAGGREPVVVVSNDTYVSNNARAHGAQAWPASRFAALAVPGRKPGASSRRAAADRQDQEKPAPDTAQAGRITEEYRRALERRRIPPA